MASNSREREKISSWCLSTLNVAAEENGETRALNVSLSYLLLLDIGAGPLVVGSDTCLNQTKIKPNHA